MFDEKLWKFIIVGIMNTLLTGIVMFTLYHLGGMSYWGASFLSYMMGSILSFFLNKNFTFKYKGGLVGTAIKFAVNVTVCYIVAYGMAKPIVELFLEYISIYSNEKVIDTIAMSFGMLLFTALNYIGQRYFTFRQQQ